MKFVDEARKYIGTRFIHQGRNNAGMDCIGLVMAAFKDCDYMSDNEIENICSDLTLQQYSRLPDGDLFLSIFLRCYDEINFSDMKTGDLILFKVGGSAHHVAIYIEENGVQTILHAYESNGKVTEHRYSPAWKRLSFKVFSLKRG